MIEVLPPCSLIRNILGYEEFELLELEKISPTLLLHCPNMKLDFARSDGDHVNAHILHHVPMALINWFRHFTLFAIFATKENEYPVCNDSLDSRSVLQPSPAKMCTSV